MSGTIGFPKAPTPSWTAQTHGVAAAGRMVPQGPATEKAGALPPPAPAPGGAALVELARPHPPGRADTGATLASLDGLQANAGDVEQIAALLQKANLEGREAARQDRAQQRDIAMSADQKAADDIRSEAGFELAATCVSSAISIMGALAGLKGSMEGAAIREDVPDELQPAEMPPELEDEAEGPTTPKGQPSIASDKDGFEMKEMDRNRVGKTAGSASDGRADAARDDSPEEAAGKTKKLAAWKQKEAEKALGREQWKMKQEPLARAREMRAHYASDILGETGKIAGAVLKMEGAQSAADKATQQSVATSARAKADDDTDFIHAYTDNVRSIQEKLSAMQQADAESKRQILSA